jgi:type VI secretion system secreted protein VgrG
MNISEIIGILQSSSLTTANRPMRLCWGPKEALLGKALLPQRVDIREAMFDGIDGAIWCLSTRIDLPLNHIVGVPVSVQWLTDRGTWHAINGIVTEVTAGETDGALACYRLAFTDALAIMDARINTRVFCSKSVPQIVKILFDEWRSRSTVMASAFDFDLSGVDDQHHPARAFTQQMNESDAHFVRRLCRREGIAWFVKAGGKGEGRMASAATTPVHTLVMFCSNTALSESVSGPVRYHWDAASEERDSVTQFSISQKLISGAVDNGSWCGKMVSTTRSERPTTLDQGMAGDDLAQLLVKRLTDTPHAADSRAHFEKQTDARIAALECIARNASGKSSVRDFAIGEWFTLLAHPELRMRDATEAQFAITSLHHLGENNLPKTLNEKAMALYEASGWTWSPLGTRLPASALMSAGQDVMVETRYENAFTVVQRDLPIRPFYDPAIHLPRVFPLTAIVVGPAGEEVHTDAMGRVKVQLQGLRSDDHAHADGAGASGTDGDSAWVRISASLAGAGFGDTVLPRVGTEVIIDFFCGDPDKIFIVGVLANGRNMPPAFSHTGTLPGNRYVSGTKTREIGGRRANQVRFDDTPGQISAQLASEHAHTQLNIGFLTHPRSDGVGETRGEGVELRTDAAAVVRAAKGLLLTTYARTQASGEQLDRQELLSLLSECRDLFTALGSYASEHGGSAADVRGQSALISAAKSWETDAANDAAAGTGTATAGSGLFAVGAVSGAIAVTPKSHLTYAGQNIDQVAQENLQMSCGQRLHATAGKGVQLFARGDGIRAVAGEGAILIQAQAAEATLSAQKGVSIASNEAQVTISAPTVRMVAADGSYIEIGNGITLGTKGAVKILSASHEWSGPETVACPSTLFTGLPTDQRFTLHYPSHTADEPALAANKAYRITLDDGRVIQGKSDATGKTSVVEDDAMRIAQIEILKSKT